MKKGKKREVKSHISNGVSKISHETIDHDIAPLHSGLIPSNHVKGSTFVKDIDVALAKEFVDDNEK